MSFYNQGEVDPQVRHGISGADDGVGFFSCVIIFVKHEVDKKAMKCAKSKISHFFQTV